MCAGGLIAPKLTTRYFGATKQPAHPEDGNGVNVRNVGKPLYTDEAVRENFIALHETVLFSRI